MANENNEIRVMTEVWDWPIRVLHWANALLVIALILLMLGKEGMELMGIEKTLREPVKKVHAYVGHIFLVTFALRLVWGFAGNRFSRWSDIIPYRGEQWAAMGQNIKWYLSGFRGRAARVVGHDPLASLFYIALFIILIIQSITGIIMAGLEFEMFPGKVFVSGMGEHAAHELHEAAEEVHEFGMLFMFFFIAAHLIGLVVHEVKEKTGLFSSMIHGRKYFQKED